MFEDQNEVRILSGRTTFDNREQARNALRQACRRHDRYALAAEDSRNLWIVMAACEE
jgi:hypothetical protein